MNKLVLFSFLMISQVIIAQMQIHTLNVATNELVYSTNTNRIYASIPSSNGSNGNSIGKINPATYTLESTVFMGSEPSTLAVSDNGQYIYAGFTGTSTVRRFNVATGTAEIQFPLGSDSFSGPFFAYDISVMPGNSGTIAVSRKVQNSTGFYGTAIYDNGVVRSVNTNTNYPNDDPYVIRFVDASTLYGFNNHSTGFDFTKMLVTTSGITEVSSIGSIAYNFNIENFVYNGNQVYFDFGTVVDKSFDPPFVVGQFTGADGRVVYDNINNLVCYATYNYNTNAVIFKRYNPETYLLHDSIAVPQALGPIKSITLCGSGCYAFNSANNKVIIITNGNVLNNEEFSADFIDVFPNPIKDVVTVNAKITVKSVQIYDLSGKVLLISNDNVINIANFAKGIYLMKIIDENGNVVSKKIIKN